MLDVSLIENLTVRKNEKIEKAWTPDFLSFSFRANTEKTVVLWWIGLYVGFKGVRRVLCWKVILGDTLDFQSAINRSEFRFVFCKLVLKLLHKCLWSKWHSSQPLLYLVCSSNKHAYAFNWDDKHGNIKTTKQKHDNFVIKACSHADVGIEPLMTQCQREHNLPELQA